MRLPPRLILLAAVVLIVVSVGLKRTPQLQPLPAAPRKVRQADIQAVNGGLILLEAAEANQTAKCKALVHQGANINQTGEFGDTPLSWAVDNENLELVQFLLDRGADPNANVEGPAYHVRDALDETPLISAIRCNNRPIIQALLNSKKLDINARDDDKTTALIEAINWHNRQPVDLQLVRSLLDRGADPNAAKDGGASPLLYASSVSLPLVKLLIAYGAKVAGSTDDSTLFSATASGHIEILTFLLDHGAPIDAHNSAFASLLCTATTRDQPEEVKFLIRRGAKINQIVEDSSIESGTALVKVAYGIFTSNRDASLPQRLLFIRQTAMIRLLIEEGADPNLRSSTGLTALMWTAIRGNLEAAKLLIARGANVNAKDDQRNSVVMWAIALGTPAAVQLLLKHGADLSVKNHDGETGLIRAVRYSNLAVVDYLLQRGAPVDARDAQGDTALIARAFNGDNSYDKQPLAIMKRLLDQGANPNAVNRSGQTALMGAAQMGSIPMVKALIAKGAHVNAKDHQGRNVLTYPRETQQMDIIRLLKRAEAGA